MNVIYRTDNPYEVPSLELVPEPYAPGVPTPVVPWGAVARGTLVGCWTFYVDDYRFDGIWKRPDLPIASGVRELAECNYSIFDDTPLAEALWAIHRKRALAVYWQHAGATVWVDLCVSARRADLALLGVPRGWQRYATAAWDDRVEDLQRESEQAARHAAGAPHTLLVYGGGSRVRDWCSQTSGAIHLPRARNRNTGAVPCGSQPPGAVTPNALNEEDGNGVPRGAGNVPTNARSAQLNGLLEPHLPYHSHVKDGDHG